MITTLGFTWDWEFTFQMLPLLLEYAGVTVGLTVASIFFGTIIGLIVALMKISKISVLRYVGAIYTWVFRGIPLLVQLFIIYFGLPMAFGINIDPIPSAILGISMCGGAYIAEIIRAGIQSVDKGQMEAALALGMSHSQAMRRIIIPQTYRRLLPPMGNEFITLLKDTSLASTITVVELLRTAQVHAGSSMKPFEMYISAGLIYLGLTTFFTLVFGLLENRLAKNE